MVAGSSEFRVRRTLVHRFDTPVAVVELTTAVGLMANDVKRITGKAPDSADWALVETCDDEVLVSTVLSDEVQHEGDMPLALAMAALTQVQTAQGQDDRPDMRASNLDLAATTLARLIESLGGPRRLESLADPALSARLLGKVEPS